MADRIEAPPFTIPAGTAIATPASLSLFSRDAEVVELEILFPPGPSGLVGVSVWHSNEQIIPATRGQWVVTDSETIRWTLSGYPTGASWQVRGYNLDVYPHTIYMRLLLQELNTRATIPSGPIPLLVPNVSAVEPLADETQGM